MHETLWLNNALVDFVFIKYLVFHEASEEVMELDRERLLSSQRFCCVYIILQADADFSYIMFCALTARNTL